MKRRKYLAAFSALFIIFSAAAQTNFYFSMRMNNPSISDQFNSGISSVDIPVSGYVGSFYYKYQKQESYSSKFGFTLSAGLQYNITRKAKFSIGLDFMKTNYNRVDKIYIENESAETSDFQIGEPIGNFIGYEYLGIYQYENNGTTNYLPRVVGVNPISNTSSAVRNITPKGEVSIYYLNIPTTFNYLLIRKLQVNFGFTLSVLLASKQYLIGLSSFSTTTNQSNIVLNRWRQPDSTAIPSPYTYVSPQFVENKVTNGSGLNRMLLLGNIGLSYNVLRSVWLDFKYNYGFTPIYEQGRQSAGKARYNFLELGLKYDLMLRKKS